MNVVLKYMETQMLIVWKSRIDGEGKSPEVREARAAVPALLLTSGVTLGSDCQAQLCHSKKWKKSGPMISKGPSTSSLTTMILKHVPMVSILLRPLKTGKIIHRCSHQVQASNVLFVQCGKQNSPLQNTILLTLNHVSLQKYK